MLRFILPLNRKMKVSSEFACHVSGYTTPTGSGQASRGQRSSEMRFQKVPGATQRYGCPGFLQWQAGYRKCRKPVRATILLAWSVMWQGRLSQSIPRQYAGWRVLCAQGGFLPVAVGG